MRQLDPITALPDPVVDPDRRLVAHVFLAALYRRAPERTLVEVRFPTEEGMRRFFGQVERLDLTAKQIVALAASTDVYVGVIPRRRRGGGRDDLTVTADVAWVDCDSPEAVAALRQFRPMPSMVLSSGSGQNCHAYWFLRKPVSLHAIESLNRRLALTLGADVRCSDPARILRPLSVRSDRNGRVLPACSAEDASVNEREVA